MRSGNPGQVGLLTWLARVGYAAKGGVYMLVGYRAIRAALHPVRPAGSDEALSLAKYLGQEFLIALSLGLACFALWRFAQTWFDPENKGTSPPGLVHRLGYAMSGVFYGHLAWEGIELLLERPEPAGDDEREAAILLFNFPLGNWMLMLVGVVIVGMGLAQFVKAYQGKFKAQLGLDERRWAMSLAVVGLVARGLVFATAGIFTMYAGWTMQPKHVHDLQEVLILAKRQPFGNWMLAAMGAGLIAYGLFMWVQARFYRVGQPAA